MGIGRHGRVFAGERQSERGDGCRQHERKADAEAVECALGSGLAGSDFDGDREEGASEKQGGDSGRCKRDDR